MTARVLPIFVSLSCLAAAAPALSSPPSAAVSTAPLGHEVLKDRLKGFGTVTLGEQASRDVSFPHGGQVVRIDAQPGQQVKAGQAVITVTTDPAAALSYRNAVAAQSFAQRDFARTRLLLRQHLATNAQVAAAQKVLTDADAALANERALGDDKGTDTIMAPTDGFVAALAVHVGDRIAANAVAMKLSSLAALPRVSLGLEPDVARRVEPGMTAFVTPVYGPQDLYLKGHVSGISAAVDPATHLVPTWIELADPAPRLPIGSEVNASIILREHEATVVPRDAVLHDGKGDHVFSVRDGVAHRIDVATGLQTDAVTELLTPVDPTLRVVTVGNYELTDGMPVHEVAMAKPNAGPAASGRAEAP